jgi:hypothetical protein
LEIVLLKTKKLGERMKRLLFFMFLIGVSILLGSTYEQEPVTANKVINLKKGVQEPNPPVEQLATSFMEQLIQTTDEHYRVENFQTKEQLINSFKDIANLEIARKYVEYYYYEESENLYVVPTETPPWFEKDNAYTLIEVTKGNYRLTQENFSEIHGNYLIYMDFKYENEKWHIENVTYD